MKDMRAERGSSAVMLQEECDVYYSHICVLGYGVSSRSPEIASPDSFILLYYLLCVFISFSPSSFTI